MSAPISAEAPIQLQRPPSNRGPKCRASGILALFLAATVVLGCGIALTAQRAWATFEHIVDTGKPGLLTLSVDSSTPMWATLAPGESTQWLVRAELSDAAEGSLSLELDAQGSLVSVGELTAAVASCSQSFTRERGTLHCTGASETVLAPTPLRELAPLRHQYALADLRANAPRELLVTLQVPDSVSRTDVAGATARVGLGLHTAGDTVPTVPPTDPPVTPPTKPPPLAPDPASTSGAAGLAVTGADLTALGLLAAGLAGLGAALALLQANRPQGVRRR